MSVKHLKFLKKALYKYEVISIKVGLFVLVGLKCGFFFLPKMYLPVRSTHLGNCLTAFAQKFLPPLSKDIFPEQLSVNSSLRSDVVFPDVRVETFPFRITDAYRGVEVTVPRPPFLCGSCSRKACDVTELPELAHLTPWHGTRPPSPGTPLLEAPICS